MTDSNDSSSSLSPSSPSSDQVDTSPAPSLFRRLAALLYDTLLVAGVLMFGTLIVILVMPVFVGGDTQALPSTGLAGWLFKGYLGLIVFGFFSLFWVRSGRTLGMQVWALHIEDQQGGGITLVQSIKRMFGAILSIACGGLGYLWILFDAEGCAWHDRISGTRVRWVPKVKKR